MSGSDRESAKTRVLPSRLPFFILPTAPHRPVPYHVPTELLGAACFNAAVRDIYGNALETGGEAWFVRLRGEEESVSDAGVRHPLVTDYGDGSYAFAVRPGSSLRAGALLFSQEMLERIRSLTAESRQGRCTVATETFSPTAVARTCCADVCTSVLPRFSKVRAGLW